MKIRIYWIPVFLAIAFVGSAFAAKKQTGPYDFSHPRGSDRSRLRLYFEYSPEYNSNVLRYSSYDENRFDDGVEPHPSPVASLSQWRQQLAFRGSYSKKLFLNRTTIFSGSYRVNMFPQASVLNYQSLYFQVEQSILPRLGVKVAYNYLNDFMLRNFVDRDTKLWESARFDQNEYSFKFPITVTPQLEIEPYAQWRVLYYNKYFTEFDMSGRSWGAGATYKFDKFAEVTSAYEYGIMDNNGAEREFDIAPIDPISLDSEYGDGSYKEDEFRLGASVNPEMGVMGKVKVGVDYCYRHRVYTSSYSLIDDPFHAGRKHNYNRYGFEIGGDPMQSTTLTFRLETEQRSSTSPEPKVPLYKDYKATKVGVTLSYRLK